MYSHSVSQGTFVDLKESPPEWYRIGIVPESGFASPRIFLDIHPDVLDAVQLCDLGFWKVLKREDTLCEDGFVRILFNDTAQNTNSCALAVATLRAMLPLLSSVDSRALAGVSSPRSQLIQLEVTATSSRWHQICAVLGRDLVRYILQEEDEAKLFLRLFRVKNSMVDLWSAIEPNSMPANLIANSSVTYVRGGGICFRLGAYACLMPDRESDNTLSRDVVPLRLQSDPLERPIEVLSFVAGLASLCDVYRESLK